MAMRSLVVGLGKVYNSEITGYQSFDAVQNTSRVTERLKKKNWNSVDTLIDRQATKSAIKTSIMQLQGMLNPGDSLLFYYFGHADKSYAPGKYEEGGDDTADEYLVTFDPTLIGTSRPFATSLFFSDNDYFDVMYNFFKKHQDRYLTSIFDCCYAKGLVDGPLTDLPNHTVMCSSSDKVSSWADPYDGSFFNLALNAAVNTSENMAELFAHIKTNLANKNLPEPFLKLGSKMSNNLFF